jgi:hypothetical protein
MSVSASTTESTTNNQHAGVDEGDIVKRLDDVLVVLRRGRLFTIGIGGRQLQPLSVADAFGSFEGSAVEDAWYDELLVWQRTAIVIGYNYKRGGTEIGLFDVDHQGELRHRATYHLRSSDYYSSSNYASRLIGDRLMLFTSLPLPENVDPNAWLPALRRWSPAGADAAFENIAPINRIFQPGGPLGGYPTIHTLTVCHLSRSFECEATVVLGDSLTEYYASPTAAYAWTTAWAESGPNRSMLYRIPFDDTPVSAVRVAGRPAGHLGFLEDTTDHLNVVVSGPDNAVSLLRLPLYAFSDGSVEAPAWLYRPITRGEFAIARFVGRHVLVGTPTFERGDEAGRRIVVATLEGTSTVSLKLPHTVDRIEGIGAHAVVVGTNDDNLSMTPIRLGDRPAGSPTFVYPNASESESRTHAFFYRQDTPRDGVFGLPITASTTTDPDDRSARILFIRNQDLSLIAAGSLDSSSKEVDDKEDNCRTSCVDWYGSARPIFIDDRILALNGYELIEARLTTGRIETIRRLDFMPRQSATR